MVIISSSGVNFRGSVNGSEWVGDLYKQSK